MTVAGGDWLPPLQTAFLGLAALGTVGTLIVFGGQLREMRSERRQERENLAARLVAKTFPTVAPLPGVPSERGHCIGDGYYAGGRDPAFDVSVLVVIQERHWHATCGDIPSAQGTPFTYSAVFCQQADVDIFPIPSDLTAEADDAVIAIAWSDRYGDRHWWARRYREVPQPSNSQTDYWKPLGSPSSDLYRKQDRIDSPRTRRCKRPDWLWPESR